MRRFLFLMLIGVLLTGCSSEPDPIRERSDKSPDNNFVRLDDALVAADKYFEAAYGPTTRSGNGVKSVDVLHKRSTRSQSGEELNGLYFVNYDSGFAILSADSRRPPVLALSDDGSVSIADTASNPGFADYIDQIYNYEGVASTNDFVVTRSDPTELPREFISKPMIQGWRAEFSQGAPYNLLCRTPEGKQAYVGCGPLAVGTLMAYYGYPMRANGWDFNWIEMCQDRYSDDWARLFYMIGLPQYANAKYTIKGTSTRADTLTYALNKLGYEATCQRNINNLNQNLKNKRPAVITGLRQIAPDTISGHAFVIDGGFNVGVYFPGSNGEKVFIATSTYYDIIWGWGGQM